MYDERRLNKRRDADEIRSRVRAYVEALPMNLVFAIGFDVHGLNPRDEINCHCPVGRHMVNWRLQCNLEGGVAGKGTSEFCEKAGIMTPMGLMGHLITLKEQGSALHYATYEYLQYLYADHNGGFGHKALYKQGDAKYQKAVAAEKKNITKISRQENLHLPLGADGREVCLRFFSKGDCDRSCTRSHAPLRGNVRDLVIRYIRVTREAMNKKRKFDGVSDQSHGGSWDRNGSRFGGGRGGRGGGRDSQSGGGRGGRGGNGPATNPPHQDGQKNRNGQDGGRSA